MQIQEPADHTLLLSSSTPLPYSFYLRPSLRTLGFRYQAVCLCLMVSAGILFTGCTKAPAPSTPTASASQVSCGADAGSSHCDSGKAEKGATCQEAKCSDDEGMGKCPHHGCQKEGETNCAQPLPQEEIQKRLIEAGMISEHHKVLKDFVGTWNTKVTIFSGEGQPPLTSTATSAIKPILGGRFVEEVYKGKHQGKPFEGRGLTGYDNVSQMYVSSWVDNMGTAIMMSKGHYDEQAKTFIFEGDYLCPVTRKMKKSRSMLRFESPSRNVYESYETLPTGGENKTMEIIYTKMSK